ncbi:MAG: hypothetical protein E4H17_03055 [Gemmatimonadales bacterium]|nr:MAG: hypothetical protein E4H17_03055 [Gemmatimonadales bacterium]
MKSVCAHAVVTVLLLSCVALAAEAPKPQVDNSLEGLTRRLAEARVTLEVEKQNPDRVLDFVRDAARVNILVDPDVREEWEAQTLTLKLKNEVSALSALHHILRQVNMAAVYTNEAFVITRPEKNQPPPQITVYDVRDIIESTRGFRTQPTIFGSQIDPLYYGWIRSHYGERIGEDGRRDPLRVFDYLDRLPPDQIGSVIAQTVQKMAAEKKLDISVTYDDGYLVVVHQPRAGRLRVAADELDPAPVTTGQ